MKQEQELLCHLLVNTQAHVYVCGDIKMASGVREAINTILLNNVSVYLLLLLSLLICVSMLNATNPDIMSFAL